MKKMNSHMSKIIERTDDEIYNSINESKHSSFTENSIDNNYDVG